MPLKRRNSQSLPTTQGEKLCKIFNGKESVKATSIDIAKKSNKRAVYVYSSIEKTKGGLTVPQIEETKKTDQVYNSESLVKQDKVEAKVGNDEDSSLESCLINIDSLPLFPQDTVLIDNDDLVRMKQSIDVGSRQEPLIEPDSNNGNSKQVLDTYMNKKIPPPIKSKRQLLIRTEKYIPELKLSIKNMNFTSKYFNQAKNQQRISIRRTLNLQERLEIDWDEYVAGYIGAKRQLIIATIISSRCRKELEIAEKTNQVVSYWTIDGFVTNVLANEIAIKFAMNDMNFDYDTASKMIAETVDYGHYISDNTDIIEDLQPGEILGEESKEFLREFNLHERKQIKPTKSTCQPTILDQLLENIDDSD